jgi:prefoldin subunit 5
MGYMLWTNVNNILKNQEKIKEKIDKLQNDINLIETYLTKKLSIKPRYKK